MHEWMLFICSKKCIYLKSETNIDENEEDTKIFVHVTGAVKSEGIVKIKEEGRIADAVEAANGFSEDADISQINLAYKLEDGQKIYIPSINDEKVKDVITKYYNIIQGNLKSSQVFIRATEFNSDVRKVQKAKLLIPDEQILLNDPIPQRREIREIYEKIYTRIPKVAEAEKEKANRLLEQIGMYLDYEDIDDEDIEDLIDKIKLFYETASSSLVNIHGNIQVLDGIKKDAKTISVAFSEVEKGIASTDDLDTLLMFSKDPLSKIERILSTLQAVQKDIEYVARDVEKRRGNIFVDNGGDLSTRYVESRNTIEADSKTVMDWKVM